ncbi:MAG: type III-A CRISPR-associated RAMP protein Csm3 [Dethiobacter sp.]
MALTELKFKRPHIKLTGALVCRTGLRIGGSKEDIEIGGIDNPILRDPLSRLPYIPGSSLKGKLRSSLEYKEGKVGAEGNPCGCAEPDCMVCTIFGPHLRPTHGLGPTRIIVRDALLTADSKTRLEGMLEEGLQYAEVKTENIIDRRTGVARRGGLRQMERVPTGTKFDINISLRIFEGDDEGRILNFVKEGLRLMQEDYLGGSGTRGYGWVKIEDFTIDGHDEAL